MVTVIYKNSLHFPNRLRCKVSILKNLKFVYKTHQMSFDFHSLSCLAIEMPKKVNLNFENLITEIWISFEYSYSLRHCIAIYWWIFELFLKRVYTCVISYQKIKLAYFIFNFYTVNKQLNSKERAFISRQLIDSSQTIKKYA